MNDNDDLFEDDLLDNDEIMQKVSKPPEFPPASSAQIERTWQAIAEHVAAREATARQAVPDAGRGAGNSGAGPLGWFERLFPGAPAWSWTLAQVAALLLVGFGAAWIAATRGFLPGAVTPDAPVVTDTPAAPGSPDRAWLAANDYGGRLEALLLGVARGGNGDAGDVFAPAAREVSRELLDDSRFYQRVAQHNRDAELTDLLSRIEVILLALATAPQGQEQEVIGTLREFIDESDVLGELRAVQSSVPSGPRPRAATSGS